MTAPEDVPGPDRTAPHASAEQDDRDPSRAANQIRTEPIPPRGVDDAAPASDTNQPDAPADAGPLGDQETDRPQAGAPEKAVTDLTPALGTSEAMEPVEGVHTPDVGPGGEQIDTDDSARRGRAAGTT